MYIIRWTALNGNSGVGKADTPEVAEQIKINMIEELKRNDNFKSVWVEKVSAEKYNSTVEALG